MKSELQTVRGVLAALRAKIRGTWMARGIAITVAAACAAAVVSFGLDYFLDLPLAVRAIHLGVVAVAMVLVVRWALVKPLSTPMTENDLAQAVEYGAPDLRDRLVSALDFERRIEDPAELESRELMSAVVADAARNASKLDARLLVNTGAARRATGVAALAVLLLAGVAFAAPAEFSLWLRRGLLLSDIPWPRRTHIRVLDFPESGPRVVTRGDDLRVVALAEGDHPSELVLHYEQLADPDPSNPGATPDVTFTDTRRMYGLEGEEGRYAFDFHAVSASFRLWVTGGDDQDDEPVYSVLALVAPRVASISGKIVYPTYAGLAEGVVRDASFEVLAGSRVEMKIVANMPLTSARMVPTDGAAVVVPLDPDAQSMTLSFEMTKPVDFHLELTAAQGQTNRAEDDVFHLRAVEDRAPEVRVLYPPSRLYRTPNGIVPVKVLAKDDFKIATITLDVARGSTPLGMVQVWPSEDAPPPAEPKRVDAYRALDLLQFAGDKGPLLKPQDVLHLVLRAVDSHGNETVSGDLSIEVLSEEDFERRLAQRQGTLREELALVTRNQRRARTAIAELRASVGNSAPAVEPLERGRDLQVDQGRVTNDLTQFLNGIHQVFDGYVLDRVGSPTAIDKLLPLYHEALKKPSDDEVFPPELYTKIVAEKRADRVYDPEILGALLDIMDLGERAVAELSPAVYKALVAWAGEGPHPAAELERAEKLANDLTALLIEIDQRMQRWGDLNMLIEMAREIRETEGSLSKDPAGTKDLRPK